jgi:hypothetical protein
MLGHDGRLIDWRLWRAYPDQRVCQSALSIQSGDPKKKAQIDPSRTCSCGRSRQCSGTDSFDETTNAALHTNPTSHTRLALVVEVKFSTASLPQRRATPQRMAIANTFPLSQNKFTGRCGHAISTAPIGAPHKVQP